MILNISSIGYGFCRNKLVCYQFPFIINRIDHRNPGLPRYKRIHFLKELFFVGLCALEWISEERGLYSAFHRFIISLFWGIGKLCGVALIQRLVNGSMDKLLVDQKIRSESDIEKINKEIEFKELKREKVIKLRQINNLYKKKINV